MKHRFNIIILLVLIFFLAQLLGLGIVGEYVNYKASSTAGDVIIEQAAYDLTGIEPPPIENKDYSFVYIIVALLLGTILVLLIIKFKQVKLWKFWFFLSVVLTLLMAFSPFIFKFLKLFSLHQYSFLFTIIIVLLLGYFKIYKPNIYVHNFTELFIYGGLATILIPILNLFSIVVLLLLISVYDMYAVWKSKHMITMATFQSENMLFAGLLIPYKGNEAYFKGLKPKGQSNGKLKTAVLGGGDIAFPLLFTATVLAATNNFLAAFIIAITTTLSLFCIYLIAEKNKFYPAMPFLTIGCFLGYAIVWLLGMV